MFLFIVKMLFALQWYVACMWVLIPTWVSTHTPHWRRMSCYGLWGWRWTEQRKTWCLLLCCKLEVNTNKRTKASIIIVYKSSLFNCILLSCRAKDAAAKWLCVFRVNDPKRKACGLSQGSQRDFGICATFLIPFCQNIPVFFWEMRRKGTKKIWEVIVLQ